jgi:hypothetical protein
VLGEPPPQPASRAAVIAAADGIAVREMCMAQLYEIGGDSTVTTFVTDAPWAVDD